MSEFQDKVREVVRAIPKGSVLSYQEVAKRAGKPKAARAVANIMANNFLPDIPCHRVIKSDGRPGGYNRGGESVKRRLLLEEGVVL
jgi:methylated-DNA-[protein]-cysteine S-methyltransferase